MSDQLAAALALAKHGLAVFPLAPNTKVPLLKEDWHKLATTDEFTIKRWWTQHPTANIGTPTDGLFVPDVDPRNGGDVSLQMLERVEEFPDTPSQTTRSGGTHMIYKQPPGMNIRSKVHGIAKGIDVKANGGYIVAPGSVIDGKEYKWQPGR